MATLWMSLSFRVSVLEKKKHTLSHGASISVFFVTLCIDQHCGVDSVHLKEEFLKKCFLDTKDLKHRDLPKIWRTVVKRDADGATWNDKCL